MIKLLWRTDVHMADRTPQSRKDDWTTTVLGKLTQVGALTKAYGVNAVIDGGDFFHQKSPGQTSAQTLVKVAKVHNEYPCPVYCCVGNHDCVYGDIAYLDQQPLGVLFEAGVFQRLYDDHTVTFHDSSSPTGTLSVRVVGIPYHGVLYDLDRFRAVKKGDEDYLVVVAHVLASKQGGSMFEGEDILKYDFLESCEGDIFAFGHWHKDQGITQLPTGQWVINIGSLTRGSLSQDHMKRSPAVAIMEFCPTNGITIHRHDLNVVPANEIFDVAAKVK